MARWEPGARERLVVAAVDLFTEQGYDTTTVAQIAERAGVTRSTFFRHFSDKRELLVAGQETLSRLLAEGITEAPADASPLEAVAGRLPAASPSRPRISRVKWGSSRSSGATPGGLKATMTTAPAWRSTRWQPW